MRRRDIRTRLLRTGMGCFAFFAGATALNVVLLPFARQCYGYAAAPFFAALAICGAAIFLLGRALSRADEEKLARIRRCAVPVCLAVLFAVQVLLGYMMQYTPSGDNFMLYNGSKMLALEGSFDSNPDFRLYLSRFSNQWGFLLFFTAMWRLFALAGVESIFMPMVVVQAALYVPAVLSALGIARRIRGVRGEMMTLCMLMLCMPLYLAAGVLYTDTFSLPFVMMALDLALRLPQETNAKRRFALCAAFGAVVMLGGMIKMTVMIVAIAAAIVWTLVLRPARAAACCALTAAIVLAGNGAVNQVMLHRVLDQQMVAQHNTPIIHWVMMSIPSGDNPYGGYSGEYGVTWGMMEQGASREEVMDSIYSRMKDKIYTLRYPNRLALAALRKNAMNFGDGSFGMTEMLDDGPVRKNAVSAVVLGDGAYYRLYQAVTSGLFLAQLAFACAGCVRAIRRRDTRMSLGYIAAFGAMLFLMIWEARSRYFFGFVPLIVLLCALGAVPEEETR